MRLRDYMEHWRASVQTSLDTLSLPDRWKVFLEGEGIESVPCVLLSHTGTVPVETIAPLGGWTFRFAVNIFCRYGDTDTLMKMVDPGENHVLRAILDTFPDAGWIVDDDENPYAQVVIDTDTGEFEAEMYEMTMMVEVDGAGYPFGATAGFDSVPPRLDMDLNNIWGIDVRGDVLYLALGDPPNAAGANIFQYDLTDNTRSSTEWKAGMDPSKYYRGMASNATHLFILEDNNFSWNLVKIDLSTGARVAETYVGTGAFTGCAIFIADDGTEYVEIVRIVGSGSQLYFYTTDTLTVNSDLNDGLEYEVNAFQQIGDFVYDLVGSSLLCWDMTSRRPEFDLVLPPFRMDWHDLAVKDGYLWVSGKDLGVEGERQGVIHRVLLPPEVVSQ